MQATNQPRAPKSRCTYCGSPDYGKGCRFGPHKTHFHPGDSLKCAYCGSPNYGRGCKINPTSDLHVHGINFNSMYKESIQSFLDHEILLNEIKRNYTDFQCYKHGLIDECGNKLREPNTVEEQISFSPMIRTILRLKKYLGPKIELLEATNSLKRASVPLNEDIEYYKKKLDFQDRINSITNELYQTLDEAYQAGIQLEDIKDLIKA